MRLVVLCLLLLLSPTLAHASGVHLVTDTFRLAPSWQPAPPSAALQLSAPCLACHVGTFVSATGAPASPTVPPPKAPTNAAPTSAAPTSAAPNSASPPRAPVARNATPVPSTKRVIAIGDSWRLAHGREFSIRLTPTQEECAPLVRLKF